MTGTSRKEKAASGSATKSKTRTRSSPRKRSDASNDDNNEQKKEDETNDNNNNNNTAADSSTTMTTATIRTRSRTRSNSESMYQTPEKSKIKKRSAKSTTAKTKKRSSSVDKTNTKEVTTKPSSSKKRSRSKSPAKGEKDSADNNNKVTMDVKVHRLRHLEYIPSPILAMTGSSSSSSSTSGTKNSGGSGGGYVAIAREDGSYQLSVVSSVQEQDSTMETANNNKESSSKSKTTTATRYSPHIYPVTRMAGSTLAVAHSLCWVKPSGSSAANAAGASSARSSSNNATYETIRLGQMKNMMRETNHQADDQLPTCVAASPDGTLWIVNFEQSQLQSRFSSGGGGIFDLATCQDGNLPLVAAACQDGSVRIFQVMRNKENNNNNGQQQQQQTKILDTPIATLTTAGSAILSLAWRLVKKLPNGLYETVLFAGVADGTIRKYKVHLTWKGNDDDELVLLKHQSHALRMTMESKGRRQSTKVWTMKALQDGTLITGNSLGQIQFWNSDNGTLIQSILQSNLKADILQLAVNQQETKVFCTGVDSRVVCCERASYKHNSESHMPSSMDVSPWVLSGAQRPHTHDIKAMVLLTSDDGRLETMVTGGVDTKLCSYVTSDFSKRRPQVWYPWPSHSPITTAPSQRIFSMQRSDQVEIYRLEEKEEVLNNTPNKNGRSSLNHNNHPKFRKSASDLVGSIKIGSNTNLITSSLSPNGKWLAVCDASSTFVFKLNLESNDEDDPDSEMFQPEQMELPDIVKQNAATAFHFSGDVLFMAAASTNALYAIDLTTMEYCTSSGTTLLATGADSLPIHSIRTSKEYVVTLSHARESGVQIFRRGDPSSPLSFQSHWTLPSLEKARIAAVCLLESGQLAVATFSSRLIIFDLQSRQLSKWSEQIGYPIKKWPAELSARRDFPVRLISNPSNPSQLILASFGAFCVINLDKPLPDHCRMVPESHVRRRKKMMYHQNNGAAAGHRANKLQKLSKDDPNANNCIICLHYNSMLYMDFLGANNNNEMMVVEQPWLQVVATFPEAVQRRVYGVH